MDHKDLKELKGDKEAKELLDHKVQLVARDHKELLDHKV